jgi:hypothetical protein
MNEQTRTRRLPGAPPSFADSPLAAVWAGASDRYAMAADNIACIRETRREERPSSGRSRSSMIRIAVVLPAPRG